MKHKTKPNNWRTACRVLLLVSVLICQIHAMADSQAIQVVLANGTSEFFFLQDEPSAKFDGKMLVLKSQRIEMHVNFDGDDVVKVIYVDAPDGIKEMKEHNQLAYRIDDYGIEAAGLEPGSTIYLYDMKGALVAKTTVSSDGNVRMPISGKGVYIVKTSVSSFKIRK